jgi:hypothetical protein
MVGLDGLMSGFAFFLPHHRHPEVLMPVEDDGFACAGFPDTRAR